MVYVFKGGSIIYDGSSLTKEQREQALAVLDEVPKAEHIDGKVPVLNFDESSKELFYTYQDAPPTELPGVTVPESTPEEVQAQILMNTELLVMYKELGF